jgi:hypothetical protein
VVEAVNDVFRVFNADGSGQTGVVDSQHVLRLPARDRPHDGRPGAVRDRPGVPVRPEHPGILPHTC